VLIVWEPVLPTDVRAPSSWTLKRISDLRVSQYSDRERLLSHAMGEHDRRSIVWDYIGIFEAGTVWETGPPKPVFDGRPVVQAIDGARSALERLLASKQISDVGFRISGVSPSSSVSPSRGHTFALTGLTGLKSPPPGPLCERGRARCFESWMIELHQTTKLCRESIPASLWPTFPLAYAWAVMATVGSNTETDDDCWPATFHREAFGVKAPFSI